MCDVNIATGELERSRTDVYLTGYLPIEFTRFYYSNSSDAGFLGRGWRHSFNERLRRVDGLVAFEDGFGDSVKFEKVPGTGQLVHGPGGYALAETGGNWVVQDEQGLRRFFAPLSDTFVESRPSLMLDVYGNALGFHYDRGSPTFAVTDQLGRVVEFERNALGLLQAIKVGSRGEAEIIETRYGFDGNGQLTSVLDPIGRMTLYEYDRGRLVREVLPDRTEIVWRYDQSGRCVETWRTGGVFYRRLDFDDRHRRVRVTNSLGHASVYQLDENGGIVSDTDPAGDVSETYFDSAGETIASSRNGQSEGHGVVFDTPSNRMEVSQPFTTFVYHFDDHDRLAAISSERGGTWKFEYGPFGETILEERPGGTRFRADYAPHGWVQKVTTHSGYYIEQHRTDDRRQIKFSDPYGTLCLIKLDGFGSLRTVSDELHPEIHLSYDKAGRVVRIGPVHEPPREVSYDTADNITEIVTETNRRWRFKFASTGVLEQVVNPAGFRVEFHYDTEQQLILIRKPNGEEIGADYDALGRPVAVRLPDGRTESYTYNVFSLISSVSLNGRLQRQFRYLDGQLTEIEYADGERREFDWEGGLPSGGRYARRSIERKFDERSRLLEEKSGDYSVALGYDPMDSLTKVSDTDGRSITFDYDGRKRLTGVEDSQCGAHQFRYDAGFEIAEWLVDGGCRVRFAHDPIGMLDGFVVTGPAGETVAQHSTTYAPDGKVLRESFRSVGEEISVEYRYDAAGRPIEVVRSGADVASFRYDDNDNVVFSSELGDCVLESGDRFMRGGTTSCEYDDLGRVVVKRDAIGRWGYEYNAASELIRASSEDGRTVGFRYDAFGRLSSRSVGESNTTFHWLENSILSEVSEHHRTDYLFLPTTFFCIAVNDSRFGKAFLCPDRTGAPVCMIAVDGTILWRREFRLFGSTAPPPGRTGPVSPIGFLGQYREPNSGLNYNYARFYDASTGRYLTPDPLGFATGTNLYTYASDPLTTVDPFGLFDAALGAPPMWCSWNRQQREEYRDKVNRYNDHIKEYEANPGAGIQVTDCARLGKKADQQWASSKCCNRKPPKKKKPKGRGSSAMDCKKDIDHIIDCQLGGPQECMEVCTNLVPVNSSVNQSFGPTLAGKLKGKTGQFLQEVTFVPARCERHSPRTPSCV